MANGTVRRVHILPGYRRHGLDRDMLYGLLWLALRLFLRGYRACAYDQGGEHQNQFPYGHRHFSF
jgi:hypothetical protein